MIEEIWKDVEGYEGLYQVSNCGRIRNYPNKTGAWNKEPKIIKTMLNTYGYPIFSLCKDGKRKTGLVHRLVAQAFIPNPDNLPQVNHKDENKENNSVENLEWCTLQYNNTYGNRIKKATEKTSKRIFQYTLNGVLVNTYKSLSEAARSTGKSGGNISQCCHGKYKQCYGYIWSYDSTII